MCASVSLPVLPGPGSGHTFCRRCERLFRCAWLLFCEPFFPCLRTLSPFAVAVAISPLFGSNLDTFVMAAAAQAAETTTWPCHGQLAMFHTHAACQTFYNRISQLNRRGDAFASLVGGNLNCSSSESAPETEGERERRRGTAIIV